MKLWHWTIIGVVIVGLFSGPGVLEAAASAQPTIEWTDIPFFFLGSLFGMLYVLGIQLFRREPKPILWAMRFFGLTSLWFSVSGLSAVVMAISSGDVAPYSVLFFAVGVGALMGEAVCWFLFRKRFKNAI